MRIRRCAGRGSLQIYTTNRIVIRPEFYFDFHVSNAYVFVQRRMITKYHRMSALGHKRTFAVQNVMSALPPKADMCGATSACPLCANSGHSHDAYRRSRVKLPMTSPQSSSQCDLSIPIYVFSIQKAASSLGVSAASRSACDRHILTNEISRGAFQYDFFSRTDSGTTDLSDVRRADAACLDCSKQTG